MHRARIHQPRRPRISLDDLADAGEAIVRAVITAARSFG
jgi:hypothetical protein